MYFQYFIFDRKYSSLYTVSSFSIPGCCTIICMFLLCWKENALTLKWFRLTITKWGFNLVPCSQQGERSASEKLHFSTPLLRTRGKPQTVTHMCRSGHHKSAPLLLPYMSTMQTNPQSWTFKALAFSFAAVYPLCGGAAHVLLIEISWR